ncbi:MAG TPA: hypothetical protein VIS99_06785 [Terrimicrobiaceae bacterium]
MNALRTLVYFGHVPEEGAGSAIIVYRHLRRFAASGWTIRIVADWGQDHGICRRHDWPVLQLSHRNKYWPPFNPDHALSRAVRAWLWAREVRTWLGSTRPDAAFTYLSAFSDTLSLAAAGFAKRYRLPLATIIHDDSRCFADSPADGVRAHARRQWIVENSTKAWFASENLAACFQPPPGVADVLPPIPEGIALDPTSRIGVHGPLLVYAGNYWPPQLVTLARIAAAVRPVGARVEAVIKDDPKVQTTCADAGISWRPPWSKNTDALRYFATEASAMLVSYGETSDAMPWTRSSFPSKLIEYCHLGLPLAIVAPDDTAVVAWARERSFPDVFRPNDDAGLARYAKALRDPAFRSQRGALSRRFAESEFNAVAIQRKLQDSLMMPLVA